MPRKLIGAIALFSSIVATHASAADYFQQSVNYEINVRLDTDRKWISGSESIQYTNNSPDTLREFYLHLYPNAFRSKNSALMKNVRRGLNASFVNVPGRYRSWLDLADVAIDGVAVQPIIDDTIAKMTLPRALAPGATMTVQFLFEGKIRKHMGRAGYRGKHYDFAQWYPKVVVYDENGFHPDPFDAGEFYGEFGTFDVEIELPSQYVVAATGTLAAGDAGWSLNAVGDKPSARGDGSSKKVRFHAENVHDFAWSADPTFIVQKVTRDGIEIRSFYRAANASSWQDTTLAHGTRALDWLTTQFGPYPYPQVSIVDALLKGGMEYPMLVMDGRADEGLVVHEVGHIYFYGILANDERAAAWMDEGFTTFQTASYMTKRYGPWGNRAKWNWYQRMTPQYQIWAGYRQRILDLQRRGYSERVAQSAEKYQHSYGEHVYRKAALTLNALRYVVGDEDFSAIMHQYYERWQLKHVNEERFRAVVEDVAHVDVRNPLDQWLHTPKICDYKLAGIATRAAGDSVDVAVKVERQSELFLPVELAFTMPNGSVEKRRVDGKLRTIKSTFRLAQIPAKTALNPNNEIMDINLSDNFLPRRNHWQVDWPNNYYHPEDAYEIRHRPTVWYNDVDEAKIGYHFRGSYMNWSKRRQLGLYYGVKSKRLDFSASADRPMHLFNTPTRFVLSGYKMEGRQDFDVRFVLTRRPSLIEPPTQTFIAGYNYHELTNAKYLTSGEVYDTTRADVGPFFGYAADPQFDLFSTRAGVDLKLGRKWFGGKNKYERIAFDLSLYSRRELVPVDLRVRGFMGFSGGDVPPQQRFQIAGGGPLAAERKFWQRSPGAVWPDLNYHEPGDGNLRGYREGTFGVHKLVAFNAELGTRVPFFFLKKLVRPLLGDVSWYGFYDAGNILDSGNPLPWDKRVQGLVDSGAFGGALSDAGIGFVTHRPFPFWDLRARFDMPFYVSNPEVNGETDRTGFRYLFSLSTTF